MNDFETHLKLQNIFYRFAFPLVFNCYLFNIGKSVTGLLPMLREYRNEYIILNMTRDIFNTEQSMRDFVRECREELGKEGYYELCCLVVLVDSEIALFGRYLLMSDEELMMMEIIE